MNIKVEKRFPFGFKGLWAKVYKLNVENEQMQFGEEFITYQQHTFVSIASKVQIKLLEDGIDKSVNNAQPIQNLVTQGEFRLVKTTDAYYNVKTNQYECVIQPNDIVNFNNEFWVCEKIDERSIYNPAKQTVYYVALRKIFDNVIVNNFVNDLCEIWVTENVGGVVELVPSQEVYRIGDIVEVVIAPDDGYVVDQIIGVTLDDTNRFKVQGSTNIDITFKEQ